MNATEMKGHVDMLVLAVLEDGPKHGYAIADTLRRRSGDVLDLPDGTIYPALHRLEAAGLISGTWGRVQGRRRRTYAITKAGQPRLEEQRRSWREFLAAVDGVIAARPQPAAGS